MVRIVCWVVFVYLGSVASAQVTGLWYVRDKISTDNYGYSVSTSKDQNVFVSGAFSVLDDPKSKDMGCFLACYSSGGELLWKKQFYSDQGAIRALNTVDSHGNVILAGPGILKFDKDGTLLDTFPARGMSRCEGLAVNSQDQIVLAGFCFDSIIGDKKINGIAFVSKYSKEGNQLWAKNCYIRYGFDQDFDLTIDNHDNIFICGGFSGTVTISKDILLTSNGIYDVDGFVLKYDADFNPLWSKNITGRYSQHSIAAGTTTDGAVLIAGVYSGTATCDNWSLLSAEGSSDVFVLKIDKGGEVQWLTHGGGKNLDKVREISVDEAGNSFITGYYRSPETFKWENLTVSSGSKYQDCMFLLQLNNEGDPVALLGSQNGGGEGLDLFSDNSGNLFLTGGFGGDFNFSDFNLHGDNEMFLMKLSYYSSLETGLQINEKTTLFHIFPNPGKEVFHITLSDDLCPGASINVYETSGRCILSKQSIRCDERNFQCTAPPGVYLVELRSGSKRQTRKVIVQ